MSHRRDRGLLWFFTARKGRNVVCSEVNRVTKEIARTLLVRRDVTTRSREGVGQEKRGEKRGEVRREGRKNNRIPFYSSLLSGDVAQKRQSSPYVAMAPSRETHHHPWWEGRCPFSRSRSQTLFIITNPVCLSVVGIIVYHTGCCNMWSLYWGKGVMTRRRAVPGHRSLTLLPVIWRKMKQRLDLSAILRTLEGLH